MKFHDELLAVFLLETLNFTDKPHVEGLMMDFSGGIILLSTYIFEF